MEGVLWIPWCSLVKTRFRNDTDKRCFIKGMLAFFVLLLASCASRKVEKVSLPADFKGP